MSCGTEHCLGCCRCKACLARAAALPVADRVCVGERVAQKKREILGAQFERVYPRVFQELFGQINLKPLQKAEERILKWTVHRPFRPTDFLFFGVTQSTWLNGFRVGFSEQIVEPCPFLHVFGRPNYSLHDLLEQLEPAGADAAQQNHFEHARLQRELRPTNIPVLKTAEPGQELRLRVSGPIDHCIICGISVD